MADTIVEFVKQITVLRMIAKLRLERYGKPYLRNPIIREGELQTEIDPDIAPARAQQNILGLLLNEVDIHGNVQYSGIHELDAYRGIPGFIAVLRASPIQYFLFHTKILQDVLKTWDGTLHENTFKGLRVRPPHLPITPTSVAPTDPTAPGLHQRGDQLENYDDTHHFFIGTNVIGDPATYYINPAFFKQIHQSRTIQSMTYQCVNDGALYGIVKTADLFGLLLLLTSKTDGIQIDYRFHHIGVLLTALYAFESQHPDYNDFRFNIFFDNFQYWAMQRFDAGVFKWFTILRTQYKNLGLNLKTEFHLEGQKLYNRLIPIPAFTGSEGSLSVSVALNADQNPLSPSSRLNLKNVMQTLKEKAVPEANFEIFLSQCFSSLTYALCHILDVPYYNFTCNFKELLQTNHRLGNAQAPLSRVVAFFHSFGFLDPLIKYQHFTLLNQENPNFFKDSIAHLFENPNTAAVTVCISRPAMNTPKRLFIVLKVLWQPQQHAFFIGVFSKGTIQIELTNTNVNAILDTKLSNLSLNPIEGYECEIAAHTRIPIGANNIMYEDVCTTINTRQMYDYLMESLLPLQNTRQSNLLAFSNNHTIQNIIRDRFPNYWNDIRRFTRANPLNERVLSFVNDFPWSLPLTIIVNPNGLPCDPSFRITHERVHTQNLFDSPVKSAISINSFFIEPTTIQRTLQFVASNRYTSQYLWSAPNTILSYLLKFVIGVRTCEGFFNYVQSGELERTIGISAQKFHILLYQAIKYVSATKAVQNNIFSDATSKTNLLMLFGSIGRQQVGIVTTSTAAVGAAVGGALGKSTEVVVKKVAQTGWAVTKWGLGHLTNGISSWWNTVESNPPPSPSAPSPLTPTSPLTPPSPLFPPSPAFNEFPSSSSAPASPSSFSASSSSSSSSSSSAPPAPPLAAPWNEPAIMDIAGGSDPEWVMWWFYKWLAYNTMNMPSNDFWGKI